MQLEDYFDFLGPDNIRVKGTRVGVETILYDFVHRKESPDTIAREYPSLTLEQIYATITYYLHNKETLDRYLADWMAYGDRMRVEQDRNPTPVMLRLRQLAEEHRILEAQPR
jgi:uncharacterized protein (DUF433 family)